MATLDAALRLYDGYSETINQVIQSTNIATYEISQTSMAVGSLNINLGKTGDKASSASAGLGKILKAGKSIAKQYMKIADAYMNANAGLKLINDGSQTQAELQDKVFAAAGRTKSSFSDMANVVSKLEMSPDNVFSSNDEAIVFAELMQKSFKLGGADTSTQQAAIGQLTQAMASGGVKGDELTSIMGKAPMIYDAIAKYTGLSKEELMKMGAAGGIAADVIKNALFMAGKDINNKFAGIPTTFADIWGQIKNGALQAFAPVIDKIEEVIQTEGFMDFVNTLIGGIGTAANVVGWLVDTIINGWGIIAPILGLVTVIYLASMIGKLISAIPLWAANAAGVLSVAWPLLLVIGIITLVIAAARQLGASWSDIFGFIGAAVGVLVAFFYNQFVELWNFIAAFINFFGNVFRDPVAAIKILILDMANAVLGYISTIARGIEDMINRIPGVEVDITSGLDNFRNKISEATERIKDESGYITYASTLDYMDYSDAAALGAGMAIDLMTGNEKKPDNTENLLPGTPYNPTIVKGVGNEGKVKVDMANEDLKYLRDIAEREYINRFSTATLAPNVQISFGDVHETADMAKLKGTLEQMMREEIAVAAEGVF